MSVIIKIILNAAAIFFISHYLLNQGIFFYSFGSAIVFFLVFSAVNTFLKPILKILFLPVNFLTFGLFNLIINGSLVLLVDFFLEGVTIKDFFWAVVFGVIVSFIGWTINQFFS